MFSDILRGKTMIGLGDSLLFGQGIEQKDTWFNRLGEAFSMNYHNYGVSGTTVAESDVPDPMWRRLSRIFAENPVCDYFILEGGANDMWHSVPLGAKWLTDERGAPIRNDRLGTVPCTDTNTFCGAINYIISEVKTHYPRAKMLILTNYNRKVRQKNGLRDEDYVNATVEVAKYRGIPVIDNYHDIGLNFCDPEIAGFPTDFAWAGTSDGTSHISAEGHEFLLNIYYQKLISI